MGERLRRALLARWHADRVAVVLHQEHDRCAPDGREVECLVGVALARCAVTHHHQRGRRLALERRRAGEAHRMAGIRREWRALRRDPMLVRVVAQMPVPSEQRQCSDRINAARHDCDTVAVGRKQPILLLQRPNGPDLARLLPA